LVCFSEHRPEDLVPRHSGFDRLERQAAAQWRQACSSAVGKVRPGDHRPLVVLSIGKSMLQGLAGSGMVGVGQTARGPAIG
jgi:hypothetical protein